MRRIVVCVGMMWLSLASLAIGADKPGPDEAAIRAAVESYTAAYNRGDAKAVAGHWSETAEWISPAGKKIQGRAAIEQALTAMFGELKGLKIEVSSPTVRLVTGDVAIEEGTVTVVRPGEAPAASTYIAVHVKKDGNWKLDSVRETEIPTDEFARDGLDQLDWMVGEWVDNGETSTVETKVAWTKNGAFLSSSFRVATSDEDDLEGTQVIGWDPVSRTIRSWLFDSDGGFGQGVWTRSGDRWIVSFSHTLPDGSQASATNIYKYVDENAYTWQSVERRLDGESLPDIKEVKVLRAAKATPRPSTSKPAAKKPTDAPATPAKPAGAKRAENEKK